MYSEVALRAKAVWLHVLCFELMKNFMQKKKGGVVGKTFEGTSDYSCFLYSTLTASHY